MSDDKHAAVLERTAKYHGGFAAMRNAKPVHAEIVEACIAGTAALRSPPVQQEASGDYEARVKKRCFDAAHGIVCAASRDGLDSTADAVATVMYVHSVAHAEGRLSAPTLDAQLVAAKVRCWDALHDEDDCDDLDERETCSLCDASHVARAELEALESQLAQKDGK